MLEPDFSATPADELRSLTWGSSPYAPYALRELSRRAYGLPDDVPRQPQLAGVAPSRTAAVVANAPAHVAVAEPR